MESHKNSEGHLIGAAYKGITILLIFFLLLFQVVEDILLRKRF